MSLTLIMTMFNSQLTKSLATSQLAVELTSEVPATGEHVKGSGDQNICELLILIKSNSSKTLCILKTAKNKRCTLNTQGVSQGGGGGDNPAP